MTGQILSFVFTVKNLNTLLALLEELKKPPLESTDFEQWLLPETSVIQFLQ